MAVTITNERVRTTAPQRSDVTEDLGDPFAGLQERFNQPFAGGLTPEERRLLFSRAQGLTDRSVAASQFLAAQRAGGDVSSPFFARQARALATGSAAGAARNLAEIRLQEALRSQELDAQQRAQLLALAGAQADFGLGRGRLELSEREQERIERLEREARQERQRQRVEEQSNAFLDAIRASGGTFGANPLGTGGSISPQPSGATQTALERSGATFAGPAARGLSGSLPSGGLGGVGGASGGGGGSGVSLSPSQLAQMMARLEELERAAASAGTATQSGGGGPFSLSGTGSFGGARFNV